MPVTAYFKTLLSPIRDYISGPRHSELEQSIVRILIGAVLLYYFARMGPRFLTEPHLHFDLVLVPAVFLVASSIVAVWVWLQPGDMLLRRVTAIALDIGSLSYLFIVGGSHSAPLYFFYLWIIIGYGFRFGQKYLFISLGFSLVGFGLVVQLVPYWQHERAMAVGLWTGTLLVSLYFNILVGRLYKALKQAEIANAAKRQFICGVSHELRTPLNAIIGMVDLMRSTRVDHEQIEMLDCMTTTSQMMLSQIEDVLDFSKIEAGKMSIEHTDFDLYRLAHTMLAIFHYRIDPQVIELSSHIGADVPCLFNGDPHHLRQILVNLLGNAVKFTEQGRILLCIQKRGESEQGMLLRFSVRDTGIGIPERAQSKIFESFTQAEESTTRRFGGTGLGTTICKQLVELMGGSIGFWSQQGVGSEFWFELVLKPPQDTDSVVELSAKVPLHEVRSLVVGPAGAGHAVAERWTELSCNPVAFCEDLDSAKRALEQALLQEKPFSLVLIDDPSLAQLPLPQRFNWLCQCVLELRRACAGVPTLFVLQAPTGMVRESIDAVAIEAGFFSVLPAHANLALAEASLHAAALRLTEDNPALQSTAEAADRMKAGAPLTEASFDSEIYRVLIAEDNPTNRKVIQKILERAGHQCTLARDGDEALDLVDKKLFDAIVLDMNMPGMGGTDVARIYRLMRGDLGRTPIIMFSANVTPEARQESLDAGADEFLPKPIQVDLFLNTLSRLVNNYRSGQLPTLSKPSVSAKPGLPFLCTDAPSLDLQSLSALEEVSSDLRFLDDLIGEFITENRRVLEGLEASLRAAEWESVKEALHAIKGSALSVGAVSLKVLCRQIEKLSATDMRRHQAEIIYTLRQSLRQLCQELEHYRQQRKRAS